MAINVSFIIPHKGREEFLIQTIESICSQDYDPAQFEILIITQNKALEGLSHFDASKFSINVINQPENITISALRNVGATQAKGQYLAFLDADVQLSENWIKCMLATLCENSKRLLVSAAQINGFNAPPLEKIRTALSNAELDCNVNFLPGRNLFLSKETFNRVNGFPEHLITCEDYYFTDQVHQIGELYYTSQATYVHLGEDKQYNEMYKKEIWRGQSNLQSIKGRKIPLREMPSFIIPIALFILFIICLFAIVLNAFTLAAFSFILFLIPIAAYSLRLNKLAKDDVKFRYIFKFYLVYFPARALGTLGGLFKSFSNSGIK
jgi:glycosyltransferase involved in cell wall biosynthesis